MSRKIHIDWQNIPNYAQRTLPCSNSPGTESWSPLFSSAISPTQGSNIYSKGYVQISITLVNDAQCTLSKDYLSLQYYVQPGTEDLVIEIPVEDVTFTLTYLEACKNCTSGFNEPRRPLFRSSTVVTSGTINNNGTIQLKVPNYITSQSCQ